MKPEDLKALLEKASPRPWHMDPLGDAWILVNDESQWQAEDVPDAAAELIVALVNRADLLIELWEAATDWRDHKGTRVSPVFDVLAKLEES